MTAPNSRCDFCKARASTCCAILCMNTVASHVQLVTVAPMLLTSFAGVWRRRFGSLL